MSAIITPKASCFGGAPDSQEGGWSYHREFAWPLQGFWTMVGWPNLMSKVWTMAHMVLAVHVLSWHGGLYVYHPRDTYDIVWLFLPAFTRPYSCGKYTLHSHWTRILQKTKAIFCPRRLASMSFHTRPKWESSSAQYLSTQFLSANHYYVENPSVSVGKNI